MYLRSLKSIKICPKLNVNSKTIWTSVLFLSHLLVAVFSSSVNYCGARMCANTNAHTFCQFRNGLGAGCIGYIEAPLTSEEKTRVIARLNRRRSDAASGRLPGLPPAGNMLKLRWVEELAREAQLWADQCRAPKIPEEHDVCRDLYSTTVGQCVASVIGEAPGLRVESMVDMWYMQTIHYKGNVTSYKLPTNDYRFYGDFGQILWASTYMVGCGRSRFMAPSQGRLRSVERLVCNFAPRGPPASRALWSAALPASACSSRSEPDRVLTALCTYQLELDETHDLDNSMTLEEHITLNAVLEMEDKDHLNYHGSLDELYLTKLAVITMQSIDTSTAYYSSMQKRDIAEFISIEDAKADIYKIVPDKNILQNMSAILNMMEDGSDVNKIRKNSKKKLIFVGRPKPYNIEDLNEVKHELGTQNVLDKYNEEVSQREKALFYAEYGTIESENENITIPVEFLNETNFSELPSNDVTRSLKPDNVSIMEITTNIALTNITLSFNDTVRQNLEDYTNDSETVQELQEALDRMEQTLEPTLRILQGKVRRDLRDLSQDINVHGNTLSVHNNSSFTPEDLKRNKTMERGPMLNMVLRYMPYLQHYEDGMLGNPANRCKTLKSTYFSFLPCLYLCLSVSVVCF